MGKKTKTSSLPEFDIAEHLNDPEAIAIYLSLVLEENDASELAYALGVIARARGMTDIARESNISREALYKALRPGAQPRVDTVARVCAALGVKLTVQPINHA
jgi:probable addiction module antidote protein